MGGLSCFKARKESHKAEAGVHSSPVSSPSVSGPRRLLSCLSSQSSALSQSGGGSTSAAGIEARSRALGRRWCPAGIMLLALVSLLSCLLPSSEAKVYSRCELARVLHDFGLDGYRGYSLADWVCLAYFTSGFNTAAVDHEADGSTNNGIFQINSRRWCRNFTPNVPSVCRMHCSDLLNPNLKDTVICAMKITQQPQGLGYWEAWRHHCQRKDLTEWVDGCDF
ncbi:sperm acrosome membrane-associated protein 3 isoform X2 [Hylobates moloch]|uniref:sperm acrosome membrane-associated protein 3 isoform X2 n=1 Tax=Hylobates moloch TaxID=81572 RepID=UPI002674C35A|nr:sperm acrosome membrane-associated protein 3 isoform X2 [Hylobates moloch]XP_058301611.1 sperm acrosome membrane-associated protein 3 isoform X2 [Hylobates moloch]XP_058301612.1 sperm acrosome membrane-associated protein 3 isoform X2 [Hylobates moloch]